MTDANTFINFVTFDGNGVIGVDLNGGKGATFDEVQFGVAIRNF